MSTKPSVSSRSSRNRRSTAATSWSIKFSSPSVSLPRPSHFSRAGPARSEPQPAGRVACPAPHRGGFIHCGRRRGTERRSRERECTYVRSSLCLCTCGGGVCSHLSVCICLSLSVWRFFVSLRSVECFCVSPFLLSVYIYIDLHEADQRASYRYSSPSNPLCLGK